MAAPAKTTEQLAPAAPAKATEQPAPTAPAKTEPRRLHYRDPFDLIDELQQDMARFFGSLAPRTASPTTRMETIWAPRADVFEKDGHLMVKAELPGVAKEDIKLEMEDSDLVITGERKSESEVKEDEYYRLERSYGSFHRRVRIPFKVTPDQIKATYEDGVLEVDIPRPIQTVPKPHQIAVH